MFQSRSDSLLTKPLFWAAVIVAVGVAATAFYYTQKGWEKERAAQEAAQMPAATPSEPIAEAPEETGIQHPVPQPAEGMADSEPLPELNASDPVVAAEVSEVVSPTAVAQYLVPENIVRNFVVTVDNLPRKKAAVERRPLKAVAGQVVVTESADGETFTLSEESYARYAPLITLLQKTDTEQLANLYTRMYPLFQQAYEDLGYPDKYFNDRMVEVIDHLLETPEVRGPIKLVRPNVFYEYADPRLEGRSAGQKTLIRMGPENAAVVKQKLREFRAAIAVGNGQDFETE